MADVVSVCTSDGARDFEVVIRRDVWAAISVIQLRGVCVIVHVPSGVGVTTRKLCSDHAINLVRDLGREWPGHYSDAPFGSQTFGNDDLRDWIVSWWQRQPPCYGQPRCYGHVGHA